MAPGFRERANGHPIYTGSGGFSWAATALKSNGGCLHFSMSDLGAEVTDLRAYGFQLRCLSE
ncbi:hypothetical protein [uncultured Rikenella sp.]|uniref:hypothetical protein n=1 Tax=uncultured Rikenella sp. TaxID=368003 RepID=UPI002635E6C5|nr:hypothetical protein [uncultured Rikenella sp.]